MDEQASDTRAMVGSGQRVPTLSYLPRRWGERRRLAKIVMLSVIGAVILWGLMKLVIMMDKTTASSTTGRDPVMATQMTLGALRMQIDLFKKEHGMPPAGTALKTMLEGKSDTSMLKTWAATSAAGAFGPYI